MKKRIIEREREEEIHGTIDPSRASHGAERIAALERDKGGHWLPSIIINGTGAIVTFVVLIVIAVTKFTHGAWAVVVVIGLIVLMFRAIHRHYSLVSVQLALTRTKPLSPLKHRVIVPISGVHRGVLPALRYAKSICGSDGNAEVNAVYVEVNPQHTEELRKEWEKWGMNIPLTIIESPYRSITTPLIEYINEEAKKNENSMTTVVLPEFIPRGWWQHLLHNQTTLLIKGKLLFDPNIIVTSVPYHLRR